MRFFLIVILLMFALQTLVWAGVPVRPGIPIYYVTVDGHLYVDKKSILDEWLKENDCKLINSDKNDGEAYTIKDKSSKLMGYVIIDRNSSMKHAWDYGEIEDKTTSADLKGYLSLIKKYDFDIGECYPGLTITNLKVYGPR